MPHPCDQRIVSVLASDAPPEETVTYRFKPSALGAPHEFTVQPTVLAWRIGRHAGEVPYRAFRRVRLSFRPVTMASQRYLAEIWAEATPKLKIASTSWRSIVEQQRQDAAYAAFLGALHRRLGDSGSACALHAGTSPWLYWPGIAVFVGVALVLAFLLVRALQAGSTAGAAFVGGFLVLFVWQLGTFFQRNRPQRYGAGAIPRAVLPRG
jgi:hypothetical protein